jgi:hypothetical protein
LQILDAHGTVLRSFRSDVKPAPLDTKAPFPTAWLQPEEVLPAHIGLNRFVWDLRTTTPAALGFGYGMGAIIGGGTDRLPQGPLVLPGTYQVRLIVNGKPYTQPLTVRQDPRVSISSAALTAQWKLEQQIMQAMQQSHDAYAQAQGIWRRLGDALIPHAGARPSPASEARPQRPAGRGPHKLRLRGGGAASKFGAVAPLAAVAEKGGRCPINRSGRSRGDGVR